MTGRQGAAKDGGEGHPLPGSAEAREDEVPEHLVREKGHGDDARPAADPSKERLGIGTPTGRIRKVDRLSKGEGQSQHFGPRSSGECRHLHSPVAAADPG